MLKKKMYFIITLFLALSCVAPQKKKPSDAYYQAMAVHMGYVMNSPDEKHILGLELDEISGIEWLGGNEFAAIHDEEGRIFIYNWEEKKVTDRIKFGKNGDYEDIESVEPYYYVLKSNGHIYRKKRKGEDETKEFGNPIKSGNDAEGLTYLKEYNSLLIALKGKGEVEDNEASGKAFYLFDLEKSKMKKDPLFTITKKKLRKSLPDSLERYSFAENVKLGPSGVAVHPKTGELFVLSASDPWLIVLDDTYKIKYSIPLDRKIFRQAEGICFTKNGDLYISNEAGEGSANILKFKYRP